MNWILIVAECNVNVWKDEEHEELDYILIVAECNVNEIDIVLCMCNDGIF